MMIIVMKSLVGFNVVFVESRCTTVLILKHEMEKITGVYQGKKINYYDIKQERNFFFIVTSSCTWLGQEDREEKSNLLFVLYRIEINVFFFMVNLLSFSPSLF